MCIDYFIADLLPSYRIWWLAFIDHMYMYIYIDVCLWWSVLVWFSESLIFISCLTLFYRSVIQWTKQKRRCLPLSWNIQIIGIIYYIFCVTVITRTLSVLKQHSKFRVQICMLVWCHRTDLLAFLVCMIAKWHMLCLIPMYLNAWCLVLCSYNTELMRTKFVKFLTDAKFSHLIISNESICYYILTVILVLL